MPAKELAPTPTAQAKVTASPLAKAMAGGTANVTASPPAQATVPAQAPIQTRTPHNAQAQAASGSTVTFSTQTPQASWGTPTDSQVGLNSGV